LAFYGRKKRTLVQLLKFFLPLGYLLLSIIYAEASFTSPETLLSAELGVAAAGTGAGAGGGVVDPELLDEEEEEGVFDLVVLQPTGKFC